MANVRVAINGFGRIGRLAFRQMFGAEGYEVVAINDLTSPKMLAHLLKYDTMQGNYVAMGHEVTYKDAVMAEDGKTVVTPGSITVDGKEITIYAMPKASDLPWKELKVDVVLECTGFYTSKAKAQAHIDAGARKVVISAPAGNDLPTIVYNVNHKTLKPEDTIISAASCTTNCLAPMAKALNDYAPVVSGIMTTVHAYTGDQMILDGPQRKGDLRRSRRFEVSAQGRPPARCRGCGRRHAGHQAPDYRQRGQDRHGRQSPGPARRLCGHVQTAGHPGRRQHGL